MTSTAYDVARIEGDLFDRPGLYRFREWVETDGDLAVDDWASPEVPYPVWCCDENDYRECAQVREGCKCIVEYLGSTVYSTRDDAISQYVETVCGDFVDDYDIDGLADDLLEASYVVGIGNYRYYPSIPEDFPPERLSEIIARHALTTDAMVLDKVSDRLEDAGYDLGSDAIGKIASRTYARREDGSGVYYECTVSNSDFLFIADEIDEEASDND